MSYPLNLGDGVPDGLEALFSRVYDDEAFALSVLKDPALRCRVHGGETLGSHAVREHEEAALHVVRTPELRGEAAYTTEDSVTLLGLALYDWEAAQVAVLDFPDAWWVPFTTGAPNRSVMTEALRAEAARERLAEMPEAWDVPCGYERLLTCLMRRHWGLAVRAADEMLAAPEDTAVEDLMLHPSEYEMLAREMQVLRLYSDLCQIDSDDALKQRLLALRNYYDQVGTHYAILVICREGRGWLEGHSAAVLTPFITSDDEELREAALRAASRIRHSSPDR